MTERKDRCEGTKSLQPPLDARDWRWRYGMAVACVVVAFAIRYFLTPMIGSRGPFMTFTLAALLAARFGGLGPGLATLGAGWILGDYYFLPPVHSWAQKGPAEVTLILTYTVTTAAGVVLVDMLARSKRQVQEAAARAKYAAEQAQRRGEELEREVAERKRAEAELQKAKEALSHYADELEGRVAERTAKLQESVRSLESVLYHVAHDLRAPLRAMNGFTTLLLEQYAGNLDAAGKDYARRVSKSARRMDELLQDLLAYGNACRVEVIPAKVELEKLMPDVLDKFSDELRSTGAKMEAQRPLPSVWADRRLLEAILANLVNNALKFVPDQTLPRVQIWAERRNSDVRIWVEDNGIGIEPCHQERIFRVFERINPTQTDRSTGIGLAIVHKLAQRMSGEVGVVSTFGQGSRFWVEFPCVPDSRV